MQNCLSQFINVLSCFSRAQCFACQAPLPMGSSRQEYWSGLPCPLPEDLPNPGTEPESPALQADSLPGKPKVKVKPFSRVRLFATLWTVAYQDPQSMGLSRQEYWRGLPFPSPGDLPNPGTEPESPAL